MRFIVFGGCGAWPAAGRACSGYLVEHAGFRILIDPGYAVLPELLKSVAAEDIDAVLVSHGHPDHCADLNPLLRARALGQATTDALHVYVPTGAVDAVLALDETSLYRGGYVLNEFELTAELDIGPFHVATRDLPHFVPNAGLRITAGGTVIAYTGDSGSGPDIVQLAQSADLLVAESTYVETVPERSGHNLSSAARSGEYAAAARVGRLVLTHLWPGTDPTAAVQAAQRPYDGPIDVASAGLNFELGA